MPRSHPLLPNLDQSIVDVMLAKIGAESVEELFSDIPGSVRLGRPLRIPEGESEYSVRRDVGERLAANRTHPSLLCFMGGGVWPHYIPAVVESVLSRQEFYTSYTPYQAEVSQGMLQALFEYQSLMCDLLGMEACNSSMYDWASAAAEAARMAVRVTGRKTILAAGNVGPERLDVVRTYADPLGLKLDTFAFSEATGLVEVADAKKKISTDVAAVYLENPNYFGVLEEDIEEVVSAAHRSGALVIVGVDPISLSLVKDPGSYGADIVVGEGQPLGIPMNYGGPHLGVFAVRDLKLARSMPGRLIGLTTTVQDADQQAFAMVLQTREQHIRRESATSNICTNQALMALAAGCYLSLMGKTGFRALGESVISNSHYAVKRLAENERLGSPLFSGAFFKEFVLGYERRSAERVYGSLPRRGVLGGYPLTRRFELPKQAGLYCVTEIHTAKDIDRLAAALEEVA